MMLPLSDEHILVSRYILLNAGTNFLLNYSLACSVLMPPTLLTNLSISWTQEKALAKDSSYLSAVLASSPSLAPFQVHLGRGDLPFNTFTRYYFINLLSADTPDPLNIMF